VEITLPYNYTPRDYQLPLFRAMDSGFLRAVAIWHRRAGKDKSLVNLVAKKMQERVGAYYYFFPTYQQGKKILWNGMDRNGQKFIDHIPKALRKRTDNSEMLIELKNGSIFQVIGTDNINSIVGTNPVGCVFSEYSLQDPSAWYFIRPILAENGGWAVFNYTPRGDNHGHDLYKMAVRDPSIWFVQKLTVDDTQAINPTILQQEKKEMFEQTGSDALYMQEYYCSFEAPVQGSYYGIQMTQAEKDGRITNVPYEPSVPVDTIWDLGVGDSMAIWFVQGVGMEMRVIDYLEGTGEGLQYYAKKLQEKPYTYGRHFAPHDIEVRELTNGKTRRETAKSLGIDFVVVPNVSLDDGIDAVRNILPKCWFDQTKCEKGISCLKNYHKEWDEKNKVFKDRPAHDWSSHGADAFRYFALGYRPIREKKIPVGMVGGNRLGYGKRPVYRKRTL
jgi:hypothetical protein